MKRSLLLFSIVLSAFASKAQFDCFINPSLEGPPQSTAVPPSWTICSGIGDTQPGQWGITQPASDGNTYVALLRAGNAPNGYTEGIGQQLSNCLQAGVAYFFTVDLAHSNIYSTAGPNGCYSAMALYGGATSCALTEKLWSSGPFFDTTWQTYTVTFTPSSNWCYLTFVPDYITACGSGTGYINLFIDDLSCINTAQYGVNANGTNVSCYNYCDGSASAFAYSGNPPYTFSWSPGGQTTASISGLCAGTYTVVATDNTGATVTDSVTINQPSQVPFSVSAASNVLSCNAYCSGTATANISGGTPGYTVVWTPAQDTGLTCYTLCPGTYTVTVTDTNGCITTATGTVGQMPPITASITWNGTMLCASPAYSYQWVYNSVSIIGGTAQCYQPTQDGNYSVVVYDSLGCAASSSEINWILGITGDKNKLYTSIFPNPGNGLFHLEAAWQNHAQIYVCNVLGEVLFRETLNAAGKLACEIDLRHFPAGTYLLTLQDGDTIVHRKLIKH